MARTAPRVQARFDRCGLRCGSAADGHGIPVSLSARARRAKAVPGQPLREDPLHDGGGVQVGLQSVRPAPPGCVGSVRVRARIGQPVPVGRAAARRTPGRLRAGRRR
jgi:hypothetical protein